MAGGTAARAQSPSADDIINSLKPNASQLTGPTRGIRPAIVAPTTPSEPAITRATARMETAAPAASSGERAVSLTVEFKSGSATLTPAAERTLSVLGRALTSADLSGFHFRVEGHTDTVGNPDTNRSLSQQRAEAVTAFLVSKFGMSADKLQAVGLGSDSLIVPTPDQTPEPRNRAVKVVNLGA
ncbi:MAG: OmpA family protein [Rhodospirillales bacterium]